MLNFVLNFIDKFNTIIDNLLGITNNNLTNFIFVDIQNLDNNNLILANVNEIKNYYKTYQYINNTLNIDKCELYIFDESNILINKIII